MSDHYEWKRALAEAVYNCSPDADNPNCPECGSVMNFYGHDASGSLDAGQGYWECPNCNWAITEYELD